MSFEELFEAEDYISDLLGKTIEGTAAITSTNTVYVFTNNWFSMDGVYHSLQPIINFRFPNVKVMVSWLNENNPTPEDWLRNQGVIR